MRTGRSGVRARSPRAAGLVVAALATLGGTVAVGGTGAGAAAKVVSLGSGISVTVPSGWSAGKPSGGALQVSHKTPRAVASFKTGSGLTGPVAQEASATFTSYAKGFGLKNTKVTGTQTTQLTGSALFDEGTSFTYTGRYQGQTLGGLVAYYENSKTGLACFAIVIAKPSDKPKLKKAVVSMFESVAG